MRNTIPGLLLLATLFLCATPSYAFERRGALGPAGACGYGNIPCFGFTSTCWRPWPEECAPCPSYLLTNPLPEPVANELPGFRRLPAPYALADRDSEVVQLSYTPGLPKGRITNLVPNKPAVHWQPQTTTGD